MLGHYLILSAILFSIGLFGALSRRNGVVILMSIELMLNAANLALVSFSRYLISQPVSGQAFVLFILIIAAAEVTVALAIIMEIYRSHQTIDVTNADLMKW